MRILIEDIRRGTKKRIKIAQKKYVNKTTRGIVRLVVTIEKQVLAVLLAFFLLLFNAHGFIAFEGHVVNVEAEIAQVEAPIINHYGGVFSAPVDVTVKSPDPDVSFVYYIIQTGSNPDATPNPTCGSALGGLNPQGPITISIDSVAKAIACVGDTPDSPHGPVTTEIYTFVSPTDRPEITTTQTNEVSEQQESGVEEIIDEDNTEDTELVEVPSQDESEKKEETIEEHSEIETTETNEVENNIDGEQEETATDEEITESETSGEIIITEEDSVELPPEENKEEEEEEEEEEEIETESNANTEEPEQNINKSPDEKEVL